MTAKHDIALLAKLLNKTPEEILQQALSCYANHVLSRELRATYMNFIEAVAQSAPPDAGEKAAAKRYRIAPKSVGMSFNPDKTRGRIVAALKGRHEFTREDFRQVVAEVMSWKSATLTFGINTKFSSLDDADRAWWGTLKSRDKLVEEVA